jgi:hypothetical protein
MSTPPPNPILESALALMEAGIPGMFSDPVEAWRAYVSSMRYVVIERIEKPTVAQLKAVQQFSKSFHGCAARNLVEIRLQLSSNELRLEAVGEDFAAANLEALKAEGVPVRLEPLTEKEKRDQLKILDPLLPGDAV